MIQVGVVIPSYNRLPQTRQAVESALLQTMRPHEIVVVDDGSQPSHDLTGLASLDPSVRVLRLTENGGAARARQAGIDAAVSPLIAFLDSDDRWLPDKLEKQCALLATLRGTRLAISCGWKEGPARRIPNPSRLRSDFLSGCWFAPGSTTLVPRGVLDIVGPFDARLSRLEDFDWFARFGMKNGVLHVVPEALALIERGARSKLATVLPSAATIRSKTEWAGLPQHERRLLNSWLDVEIARAALNDRKYGRGALSIVQSLARVPRFAIQLQPWWSRRTLDDCPPVDGSLHQRR